MDVHKTPTTTCVRSCLLGEPDESGSAPLILHRIRERTVTGWDAAVQNAGESGLASSRIALEPLSELLLSDLTGGEAPEGENAVFFRRGQMETV